MNFSNNNICRFWNCGDSQVSVNAVATTPKIACCGVSEGWWRERYNFATQRPRWTLITNLEFTDSWTAVYTSMCVNRRYYQRHTRSRSIERTAVTNYTRLKITSTHFNLYGHEIMPPPVQFYILRNIRGNWQLAQTLSRLTISRSVSFFSVSPPM